MYIDLFSSLLSPFFHETSNSLRRNIILKLRLLGNSINTLATLFRSCTTLIGHLFNRGLLRKTLLFIPFFDSIRRNVISNRTCVYLEIVRIRQLFLSYILVGIKIEQKILKFNHQYFPLNVFYFIFFERKKKRDKFKALADFSVQVMLA